MSRSNSLAAPDCSHDLDLEFGDIAIVVVDTPENVFRGPNLSVFEKAQKSWFKEETLDYGLRRRNFANFCSFQPQQVDIEAFAVLGDSELSLAPLQAGRRITSYAVEPGALSRSHVCCPLGSREPRAA